MKENLKVAVIGIGHLGKEHARIYKELPNCDLVGICDTDPARQDRAEVLGVPLFTRYQDLIGKVDAVSVATPTNSHYVIAREFLKAGIHTLIEKPITLKLEEADELIELSRTKKCALQVGHIERHNPGFKRIGEIAKNIRFFEIHRLGPFTGRINDCGVVLDLMIHDLDIVLGLVKSEVANFDAVGINVLTPFEDIANVRIKFKNGAVADLTASRLTFEKQRKIRIFQEDAYISLDYEAQSAKIFRKTGEKIEQEIIDIQKSEPLKEELKFFLNGIETGQSLGKPDEAARNALRFALDIVEYIKKNNRESITASL
jgi:predicted dehydrogenase